MLKSTRRYAPWGGSACAVAAEKRHLEILQWALENNFQWSDYVCTRAARKGHLKVLKWLIHHGWQMAWIWQMAKP